MIVTDYFLLAALAFITVIDIRKRIIPDALVICVVLLALLNIFAFSRPSLLHALAAAVISGGFFLLARLAGKRLSRRESLGLGDVKLMAAAGLYLGVRVAVAILTGTLAAALFAAVGLLTRRLKRTDELPFAPALCFGIAIALLFGYRIIEWYFSIISYQ